MSEYTFRDYRTDPPSDAGWYVWRLPNKFLEGVTVVFLAKLRMRGAGFTEVLSPEFDYWDGYRVHLPQGQIEWAEYDGEPPEYGHEVIDVVEAENAPCPFCKRVPKWRYRGRGIGTGPTSTEYWYLECCRWFDGFRSRMENPIALAEKRNSALNGE